jgi:hypothetical protein
VSTATACRRLTSVEVLTASLLPLVLFQVVEESPEVGIQDAETIDGGG